MHVTPCGVEYLILDVGAIFDNTFNVFSHCGLFHGILMEWYMNLQCKLIENSMEATWNVYVMVHSIWIP